jgi:hypothetical protein
MAQADNIDKNKMYLIKLKRVSRLDEHTMFSPLARNMVSGEILLKIINDVESYVEA